ncbi:hypothetical protein [Nesterenkonia sp.]|uniref:hypothetical protein n=1 Tax=Nesterenkonia sp. TaxID=704201 RepID=UPI002635E45B|nr:hypothetical protein [Nesterenkonia sp.]
MSNQARTEDTSPASAEQPDSPEQQHSPEQHDSTDQHDSAAPLENGEPQEREEAHPAGDAPESDKAEITAAPEDAADSPAEPDAPAEAESPAEQGAPAEPAAPTEADSPAEPDAPEAAAASEDSAAADQAPDSADDESAEGEDAAASEDSAVPQTSQPAGEQDRGLSGFLDTLDERVRAWWSGRKTRREQARAAVPGRHAQRRTERAEATGPAPARTSTGASGTAGLVPPQSGADAAGTAAPMTGRIPLPPPPPPEQRHPGQLFTGAIPLISTPEAEPQSPPPPASELPVRDSVADQVPGTAADAATDQHVPPAYSAAELPPEPELPADPEATAVLPAYRAPEAPRPAEAPNAAEESQQTGAPADTAAAGSTASPYPAPARPPRVRRALDDQRRREVIVQKARAIEDATAAYGPRPYPEFADEEEDLYTYIPPYNLPSRDPDPEPTRTDLYRRIYVTIGAAAAVICTLWMFGLFGGGADERPPILGGGGLQEAYSSGWFSGEQALLSPDYNYYWLWPVIALGLLVHAGFQWTATQESTPRQRRSGWLVGTAALLMLPVTAGLHHGLFTLTLLASAAIAVLLLDAVRQFNLYTARSTVERRFTDGVVGLFFGFALVQAMSAVSVWLTQRGWDIPGIPALLWAGIGLFGCVWIAAFYSMTERGRITIALGLGWGMFWLIFPRLLAEVTSVWVAIGAAMGAFIVILCTQSRRHRINHAERRAAMGRPLEDII